FFNTYLRAAINQSAPTFASAIMNEYRRLAIGALEWRPDLAVEAAAHLLRYGRHFDEAGMPAIYGAAAEDVTDLAIEARARDPEVRTRPRPRARRSPRGRAGPGSAGAHRHGRWKPGSTGGERGTAGGCHPGDRWRGRPRQR